MENEIRKEAGLPAPLERVWHAIAEAGNFGTWFGAAFDGPFEAGRRLTARIVPTRVDPEVAAMQKPHEGMEFAFHVVDVESHRRIAFQWHPFAIDRARDYSAEPMTTVTFTLAEVDKGTRVIVTESGFDGLPADRRAQAYAANAGGWEHQLQLLRKFVDVPGG